MPLPAVTCRAQIVWNTGAWFVLVVTVIECCGHDGTYAMTVEGFEPAQKAGQNAFRDMKGAGASTWSTDCPLAAIQFHQFAGVKPMHPMSILARAYRGDPFPVKEGGS